MPDCHRFMKGMLSQNRNIFTLTLKTATKLLALGVTRKYEIDHFRDKSQVTFPQIQLLSHPIKDKCVSFWKHFLCFYLATLVFGTDHSNVT